MAYDPVFLLPTPRTGGTLLVSMLGVHSSLALCYELFETDLPRVAILSLGSELDVLREVALLESPKEAMRTLAQKQSVLRIFVARAMRSGLTITDIVNQLDVLARRGEKFETIDGRLNFIEGLMQLKMRKDGKNRWGGKHRVSAEILAQRWPSATTFMMVRDPRDIYASRKSIGSFSETPAAFAEEWAEKITSLMSFCERQPNTRRMVRYEDLIEDPKTVIAGLLDMVGLPFESNILQFHEQDLTLFRFPAGHLSAARIAEGLNSRTVGRWKAELSYEETRTIQAKTAVHLDRFGYL